MTKAYELLRDNLVAAVKVLVEAAEDKEASPSDRLNAATLIIERVMGKPTEKGPSVDSRFHQDTLRTTSPALGIIARLLP